MGRATLYGPPLIVFPDIRPFTRCRPLRLILAIHGFHILRIALSLPDSIKYFVCLN